MESLYINGKTAMSRFARAGVVRLPGKIDIFSKLKIFKNSNYALRMQLCSFE